MAPFLIQPLFDGPLDIVGDVHGEIDPLHLLMRHLGYKDDGQHSDGRRLVFVGDLTDRGPDSPAVVNLVQRLVESGRAQCVLGNHDLNILLGHRKHDNNWFLGKEFAEDGEVVPQVLADKSTRQQVLAFFRTLPIALERDDLRVVHACWHDATQLPAFHVTLIGRKVFLEQQDMMAKVWETMRSSLPLPPEPEFDTAVNQAVDEDRKTWFLHIANQDEFRCYVEELTSVFEDAFTRLVGCDFTNAETDRYFHMSVANNQGGDPFKNIGSIKPTDKEN